MKSSSRSKGRAITVKVTKDHIFQGITNDCTGCPIAKALIDKGRYSSVYVYDEQVQLTTKIFNNFKAVLPKRAQDFIVAFDTGKLVKPFSFRLRLFPGAVRL